MWVVTYWDTGEEPVVTLFDNQIAASQCYIYFKEIHDGCCLDNVTVNHSFIINNKDA